MSGTDVFALAPTTRCSAPPFPARFQPKSLGRSNDHGRAVQVCCHPTRIQQMLTLNSHRPVLTTQLTRRGRPDPDRNHSLIRHALDPGTRRPWPKCGLRKPSPDRPPRSYQRPYRDHPADLLHRLRRPSYHGPAFSSLDRDHRCRAVGRTGDRAARRVAAAFHFRLHPVMLDAALRVWPPQCPTTNRRVLRIQLSASIFRLVRVYGSPGRRAVPGPSCLSSTTRRGQSSQNRPDRRRRDTSRRNQRHLRARCTTQRALPLRENLRPTWSPRPVPPPAVRHPTAVGWCVTRRARRRIDQLPPHGVQPSHRVITAELKLPSRHAHRVRSPTREAIPEHPRSRAHLRRSHPGPHTTPSNRPARESVCSVSPHGFVPSSAAGMANHAAPPLSLAGQQRCKSAVGDAPGQRDRLHSRVWCACWLTSIRICRPLCRPCCHSESGGRAETESTAAVSVGFDDVVAWRGRASITRALSRATLEEPTRERSASFASYLHHQPAASEASAGGRAVAGGQRRGPHRSQRPQRPSDEQRAVLAERNSRREMCGLRLCGLGASAYGHTWLSRRRDETCAESARPLVLDDSLVFS